MLIDTIRAELVRLQVHPVNLAVSGRHDHLVNLQGSLLHYWTLPRCLDGQWLLARLLRLPDSAGPKVVMESLIAACENGLAEPDDRRDQDRTSDSLAWGPPLIKKDLP